MKINDLQINGFGKLSDKKYKFNKKINIIYGKNEAGKSTFLNFISSMFYGTSKNKNGKDISKFDRFLPWKNENFSGKISYELDNGDEFEVFRDFKKKNPVIYDKNKQNISLNYSIDKNKGIDFLYEQIGIDEEIFKNTVITEQNDIKIDKNVQNGIVQKISNIVSSGNESISYKKTIEKINKKQLDEVGTDRTKEKPINIVNDNIDRLMNSKEKLQEYKRFLDENNNAVQNIQQKIEDEEIKLALYRVINESNQNSKIKKSEIEVIKNIRDEYLDKIEELDYKIDKDFEEKIKREKKPIIISLIFILIFTITAIINWYISNNKIISYFLIGIALVISIIEIIKKILFEKNKKIKIAKNKELEKEIEKEIEVLRNNIKSRQAEIDIKQDEIKQAENEVNRLVMNSFEDKLDSDFIEEAFEFEYNELENKIANMNEKLNNLKIEKGAKQNQKEAMQEEIDGLNSVQEKINYLEEQRKELNSLNNSYNLAKEGLEVAYENIRNSLSPEFMEKLSKIVSSISNGKYNNVVFSDTEGLVVEIEDGRYVPVERLSQGTIDQMYIGLRMASLETIVAENMPIILDETFAFFDDERMANILKFINDNYSNKQIIIFTCSNREKEILNRLNIDYNLIELEK